MSYTQERLLNVLLSPRVTEKTTDIAENNRHITFKVRMDATKPLIKAAVENLFNVKVEAVRVLVVKGKKVRFGQVAGQRSDWKKAYVTLQEGHDIDFVGNKGGEK
jgi:large subunit ribosomal protein L23